MNDPVSILKEDYDQRLADVIAGLMDGFSRGEQYVLEEVCLQHPEFSKDLRVLWATISVTQSVGKHQAGSGLTTVDFGAPNSVLDLPHDFGNYRLEQEIGRGGMGVVYRAIRKSDSCPVAIKMILRGDFATASDRQRFQVEAEAAAALDHPNIVPIYEIGECQGRAFYCMKLIEGETLSQRMAEGRPLPSSQAARLLREISWAIQEAHKHGVLHRDLKPSNILIDQMGRAYVADFGLAKRFSAAESLTKSGAILGTPSYMAPEQAAGTRGQVSAVTDVYSLGAILYQALTGRPPFRGESPVDTVLMVLEQDPVLPRVLNRRVNRNLEMVAMRCLQKPQDLRYESAASLANDLDAFLRNESMSAREGRIGQVIANLFRETHHAPVLENWGLIWMWHSLVLLVTCLVTQIMCEYDFKVYQYLLVWTVGFGAWVGVFWWLRRRMGPVTFVERQIAHVWAASLCGLIFLFPLEYHLHLEPLELAPLLGVVAGMAFVVKAGILSGWFYVQAFALFLTAIVMAIFPTYAMVIFGFVSAACFYFPGLKYYRRRQSSLNSNTD